MEARAMVGAREQQDDLSRFKSPLRILLRFFKRSRDRWKAKSQAQRKETKRFRNRAADATRSRDHWRERAETAEAQLERLRAAATASGPSVPSDGAQKKGSRARRSPRLRR